MELTEKEVFVIDAKEEKVCDLNWPLYYNSIYYYDSTYLVEAELALMQQVIIESAKLGPLHS